MTENERTEGGESTRRAGPRQSTIKPGDTVYTDDGEPIGDVRSVKGGDVLVTVHDDVTVKTDDRTQTRRAFGETHLIWRCINCGEMGSLDDALPDTCPSCGGPREELMYWTED